MEDVKLNVGKTLIRSHFNSNLAALGITDLVAEPIGADVLWAGDVVQAEGIYLWNKVPQGDGQYHYLPPDLNETQLLEAETLIEAVGSLILDTTKSQIIADGNDQATISSADPAIADDTNVSFTVWLDGEVYAETADAPVNNDHVELTLATEYPGQYLVEIKRQGAGNYESGYIQIIAEEEA